MDIEFNIRSEMTNLVEKVPGLVGRQSAAWHNVVEQLAARHELHDHKDIGRCVNHFVTDLSEFEERERVLIINIFDIKLYTLTGHLQSNNVRMCAHLQDVYFSAHFFCHFQMLDLSLIQNFHGYFQTSDDVVGNWLGITKTKRRKTTTIIK